MKVFNFNLKSITTKKEMEDLFSEINYCEFCNNGSFKLLLKDFYYNEKDDMGIAIGEIYYDEKININEKLEEMINCEFCHTEINNMCITPLDESL